LIKLYQNKVPKTVENFRALCEGDRGKARSARVPLHYKGTPFHRIIPGYLCQGGDIIYKNGAGNLIIVFYREIYRLIGGESIYGLEFQDENFKVSHDKPGIVSMANRGPDKNSSQFFITFDACKRYENSFFSN